MNKRKLDDKSIKDEIKKQKIKNDIFVDGYPFTVIMDSPVIGDNLNFYTKFANFDNNKSFFNTMLELEKHYYLIDKK